MLKGPVLNALKEHLDKWLIGFDSDRDLNVNIFSGEKVNLKNAIINADAVNEILAEQDSPIRLKAGLIGQFRLNVSILSLFSESVKIELSDIHLILGSSRQY